MKSSLGERSSLCVEWDQDVPPVVTTCLEDCGEGACILGLVWAWSGRAGGPPPAVSACDSGGRLLPCLSRAVASRPPSHPLLFHGGHACRLRGWTLPLLPLSIRIQPTRRTHFYSLLSVCWSYFPRPRRRARRPASLGIGGDCSV